MGQCVGRMSRSPPSSLSCAPAFVRGSSSSCRAPRYFRPRRRHVRLRNGRESVGKRSRSLAGAEGETVPDFGEKSSVDALFHFCRRGRRPSGMNELMRPNLGGNVGVDRLRDEGPGSAEVCQGCRRPIRDRYLLNSLGRSWHEDCLKCACCEARLGEVGASLYTRANLILCKRDYLRLFGSTGHCSACRKLIPAFEMVMRARANVYHLECFACQLCGHRFCVGDRFYLYDNKILCEPDYNEKVGRLNGCVSYEDSIPVKLAQNEL